ncbi:hypothetical protein JXA80_04255 [bacterium]|nr:hypothetical protein [candidate division CSSED10-310 bacterium]
MDTIKLRVTSKVLAQSKDRKNQEQIAISKPSKQVRDIVGEAKKTRRVKLLLAGAISLEFCNNGAIWYSHNLKNQKEFDALFTFLSQFPDTEFEFVCSMEPVKRRRK